MKKTDVVTEIADAADLSKADAGRALDAFISVVTKALKAG
ncbi:MAG: HU family DNA-binding protein, partial [Xanthomonadales bacterium]|nr:HU family DNA-binding protein [Xanthomonadales bacterium]